MPIELKITNEQQIPVTLSPSTDTEKPSTVETPVWSIVSGDSTLNVAPDGLSAKLVSSDTPGDTVYLVEADALIGDGVQKISDTIKLSVIGALATHLGLTAGSPEPKPAA